jgi:signal transduction histidine kinase/CheY-like chemotaxis protein
VVPYDHYVALVDQGFETGARVVGTELPILRDWESNGRRYERWFNFVQEPMRDDEGVVEGVMSFGFDVTDLVTARRRVEAAVRELEATSRAKDEFLATVSHELRTPLGSILGWASLLGERYDDVDAVAKGAEVIHRSARAQARIIDDILDVSRIITGKLRIESRPVGVETVVRGALEVVRTSASAKDIEVDVTLPDEPCVIVGDEERLRQVVWNLLSNAIKFTERGGRVGIRLSRAANGVTLAVTDSGRGIAPEFLPHVFERFRQADSSTTRAQGGLGLGLAIVRHLVELHGGHVDVSSEGIGKGATFSVSLPVRAVAARMDAELPPALLEEEPPDSSEAYLANDALDGASVLVVDDELDAREMLVMALSAWGVDVRTAESASAALRAVTDRMPDVVISDIGMPGEDGYAFVGRLRTLCRERGQRVTAVALTAYARREDAARAIAAGFDFHVAKPIELDDLRVVVERALARAADG